MESFRSYLMVVPGEVGCSLFPQITICVGVCTRCVVCVSRYVVLLYNGQSMQPFCEGKV